MSFLVNAFKLLLLLFLLNEMTSPVHFLPGNLLSNRFFLVLISFLVYILIVDLSLRAASRLYKRKKHIPSHQSDNVTLGLKNIYYLFFATGVFISILAMFGVDIRTFLTTISIVAAAIAIITREYIIDIISGLMLSFSSYFKINDYVKIGEVSGKIIDFTLSKIVLLSDDDYIIVIPHHKAYMSEIVNHTRKASKRVSIEFELKLDALSTVEQLEEDMIHSLTEFEQYIDPQSYELRIEEIRVDSLFLKFQYILQRMDRKIEKEIRKKTVRRVVNFVKENAASGSGQEES